MKTLKLFLICVAFSALTFNAAGQSHTAEINQDGAVTLDETQGLSEMYEIDASQFDFENTKEAIDYLSDKNTDYVFYRPVLNKGIIIMYLKLKDKSDWTKTQWNAHLAENRLMREATPNQIKN